MSRSCSSLIVSLVFSARERNHHSPSRIRREISDTRLAETARLDWAGFDHEFTCRVIPHSHHGELGFDTLNPLQEHCAMQRPATILFMLVLAAAHVSQACAAHPQRLKFGTWITSPLRVADSWAQSPAQVQLSD